MNKQEFTNFLTEKVRILDGAMGTRMQSCGFDIRCDLTENWILSHKEEIAKIQKSYVDAGSQMLLTPTFQTNSIKLKNTIYENKLAQTIKEITDITKSVAKKDTVIVGDLSSFGVLLDTGSGYSFDYCIEVYKEQIVNLINAGVDVLCLETIIDISEARAFCIAMQEVNLENKYGEYAYYTTFSFDENGRLLSGTDAVGAYYIVKNLGVSAVGVNCGMGPDKMLKPVKALSEVSDLPLIVKANAGLPQVDDNGKVYFDMGEEKFASFVDEFVNMGVCVIGGCCGTDEKYISCVNNTLGDRKPVILKNEQKNIAVSVRKYVDLHDESISIGNVDISNGEVDDIIDNIFDEMDSDVIKLTCDENAQINVDEILAEITSVCVKPLLFDVKDEKSKERFKRLYTGVFN